MATKPDDAKMLADLADCTVALEDDPAAAGGASYISEKLREVRDKTEVVSSHLSDARLWHTAQASLLSSNKSTYKVKSEK